MKDLMMRANEHSNTSAPLGATLKDAPEAAESTRLHRSAMTLERDMCRLRALSLMISSSLADLGGAPKGGNIHAGLEFLLNDVCDRIETVSADIHVVANLDSLKQLTGAR